MGKEYIFRLYFVDAPEIDLSFADRAWEQAAYFDMDRSKVLWLGEKAKTFAVDLLKNGYTVVTSWQKAKGSGPHERFFGIVLIGEKNLAKELVKNGLARIHGTPGNWPDPATAILFTRELRLSESVARTAKLGGWNRPPLVLAANTAQVVPSLSGSPAPPEAAKDPAQVEPAPPSVSVPAGPAATPPPSSSDAKTGGLIDVNSASKDELQRIPGIGPVLAERIIRVPSLRQH